MGVNGDNLELVIEFDSETLRNRVKRRFRSIKSSKGYETDQELMRGMFIGRACTTNMREVETFFEGMCDGAGVEYDRGFDLIEEKDKELYEFLDENYGGNLDYHGFAGSPDYFVDASGASGGFPPFIDGLAFVEVKKEDDYLKDNQKEFIRVLSDWGYDVYVFRARYSGGYTARGFDYKWRKVVVS